MKWYSTERTQGNVDYSVPDAMIAFTKQHNIAVRGHNVFWADEHYQQSWVKSLSMTDLYRAARRRLGSVMKKYQGQVIAWDVENENLHFNFYQSRLGLTVSGLFYNWAMKTDGSIPLFLNEFNTIESSGDAAASPARYLQKLDAIRRYPGNSGGRFAIGLESHFGSSPNIAYMRSGIDTLGSAGVPMWLTEVDVSYSPNQVHFWKFYSNILIRNILSSASLLLDISEFEFKSSYRMHNKSPLHLPFHSELILYELPFPLDSSLNP